MKERHKIMQQVSTTHGSASLHLIEQCIPTVHFFVFAMPLLKKLLIDN